MHCVARKTACANVTHVNTIWQVLKHIVVTLVPRQVDFQDVPFVLELARHHSCSSTMQVCPQAGVPFWPVPALRASHPAFRQAFLPLSCSSTAQTYSQQKQHRPILNDKQFIELNEQYVDIEHLRLRCKV